MVLLTPAEELGLSGLGFDSKVRKVFYSIPPERIAAMTDRMTEQAWRRKMIYLRDGQVEAIRVLLRPIGVMPDQLGYLHYVSLTLLNALKRIPELYLADDRIRRILPLSEPEEKWLRECWGPSQRDYNPVFGRLDAVVDFTSPMWKDTLHFLEPNLSGVGGLHYTPMCEQMLLEVVLPVLQEYDPQLQMEASRDLRELFIQEVIDHLEGIGRPGRNVCFIEARDAASGPEEQEVLAQYFHDRHGMTILHADPSELEVVGGDVHFNGQLVDIAYRDYEMREFLRLEDSGIDISPVRQLFAQNRMVSPMSGDFDHKSCWELLTDPELARKYFSADERQIFRRHVLWTRVLSDRDTMLPDGHVGNLLEFARKAHEELVLKPNRAYGGEGVVMGHLLSAADWESALEQALASDEQWVVQRLAAIPVNEFPVVAPDGSVHVEPFYTVLGFAPTKFGLGIMGRASQKQVVNVAQRGGMCGVLIGRPPTVLHGPGAPLGK
jgi:hypothetical protein